MFLSAAVLAPIGVAYAGPPFATDDPVPTDYGHYELYLYSEGTWAGESLDGTAVGVEVNYGLLPDLQVSADLPVGFNIPDDAGPRFDIGDASVGLKYRILHEDTEGWQPDLSVFPSFEAALVYSGSSGSDRPTHLFLPLWAQKTFGEWSVFGGGGFRINDGVGARNSWFTGIAALKHMGDGLHLGGEFYRETAEARGENGTTAFSLGGTYDLSDSWHVVGSVGAGVADHSGSTSITSYVALEWTL
ncbi:MAG: hypothetical protein GC190_15430 [Alphaproteobacteria bacterium]|nr:hypothetical protein [Alphaproteobacteria bacterium]